jgi:hypothetical protein
MHVCLQELWKLVKRRCLLLLQLMLLWIDFDAEDNGQSND